jgi:DNA-binding XRE family transcriptional regulator
MGQARLKSYRLLREQCLPPLPPGVRRRRPRAYAEWRALRRWGELPAWEEAPPGYLLREAREAAGLTQQQLARRLDCTQQAVAQAERSQANPTVNLVRRWAEATGTRLCFELHGDGSSERISSPTRRKRSSRAPA